MSFAKRMLCRAALCAAMVVPAAAQAADNLLVNGSFENPTVSNGTYVVLSTLPGWTVHSNGVEVRNALVGNAIDGKNFIELDVDRNSQISQSFATVIGADYLFDFYYSPRPGVAQNSNGILAFVSSTNNQVLASGTYARSGVGNSGNVWQQYSLLFTAVSESTTVGFGAIGASDSLGGSLDMASVTRMMPIPVPGPIPSPVPEPSTAASLLAGLALLSTIVRRRMG